MTRILSRLLILTVLCALLPACGASGEEGSADPGAASGTAGGSGEETGGEGYEDGEGEDPEGEGDAAEEATSTEVGMAEGESPVPYADGQEEAPEQGSQGTSDEDG